MIGAGAISLVYAPVMLFNRNIKPREPEEQMDEMEDTKAGVQTSEHLMLRTS